MYSNTSTYAYEKFSFDVTMFKKKTRTFYVSFVTSMVNRERTTNGKDWEPTWPKSFRRESNIPGNFLIGSERQTASYRHGFAAISPDIPKD